MTASLTPSQSQPNSRATSATPRAPPTCSVAHRPARSVMAILGGGDPPVLFSPGPRRTVLVGAPPPSLVPHQARQLAEGRQVVEGDRRAVPHHLASLVVKRSTRPGCPAIATQGTRSVPPQGWNGSAETVIGKVCRKRSPSPILPTLSSRCDCHRRRRCRRTLSSQRWLPTRNHRHRHRPWSSRHYCH